MKVDMEGAAVLGDGRPPEYTFKMNECSTLEGTYKMKKTDKCNRCGYECSNQSALRRHLSLFLRNKQINSTNVSLNALIIVKWAANRPCCREVKIPNRLAGCIFCCLFRHKPFFVVCLGIK